MRIYYKVLLIFLSGFGLLCFALSFLPFNCVKSLTNSLCNEGRVNFYTYDFYHNIIFRLRLLSLCALLIVSLLGFYRHSIERYLLSILSDLRLSYHEFKYSIINYINSVVKDHEIELYAFGFIFIVGIFLRGYYLLTPIRIDEAGTFIFIASKPLIANIFSYPTTGHHVFYSVMVNILHNIFGDHVAVMRLPALFAGILLIPATYLLFRKISNNLVALLSSTLVAVSSPLIEYSTNARGYTIVILIFIMMLLLVYYLSAHRNIFGWLVFILLSAMGFYTIPIFMFPFGIIILWYLWLVIFKSDKYLYLKDIGVSVLIAGLLTFIVYLPIIIVYGSSELVSNQYVRSVPFSEFVGTLKPLVDSTWVLWHQDIQFIIMYFIASGFVIFVALISYANKEMRALLISTILWITILLFAKRAISWPRIWLFLIPIYFGLACTGLSYVVNKFHRNTLALSILLSLSFLTTISSNIILKDTIYNSDTGGRLLVDGNEIAKYIKDHLRLKDDNVYVVNLTYLSPMLYYFRTNKLPVDHILRYNSMQNSKFVAKLNTLIVIEVDNVLKEKKETVMQDAKVNPSDFQPGVLLNKFKDSALYAYQKK